MSRTRFYAGLFLLTLATLMLEVIQTRLLSVVTWYHLAFFVISSAMFGMTAGAVWVHWNRARFTPDSLSDDLSRGASAFALSTCLSLAFQFTLAPTEALSATMILVFVELTLAMAIPFFFSGIVVSLALTRSPYPVGVVYAVDLAGAAIGCLGVLVILQWTDAPSAIVLVAAMAAGAGALFQRPRAERGAEPRGLASRMLGRPRVLLVTLVLVGLVNGATSRGLQPLVVKDVVEKRGSDVLYVKWNYFSRILASAPRVVTPALWGPSPRLPLATTAEQISMNIDGNAGTTMFRYNGDPRTVGFLAYDLTNLAYSIRHSGRVAVIGVGSGRDVLSAWTFGARDITGVELNPIFVDLLRVQAPFARFAGVAALPGVRLVADEARSWFSRTRESFDLVQMSMIDTWAATGAGAFSLSENGLYTVEAWKTFLGHLTPHGVFTVSRWYAPGEVNETGRMISLAVAALMELGVTEPRDHIFLASVGHIATTIVSKAPLEPGEVAALRATCARLGYDILASPGGVPASKTLGDITSARTRGELQRRTSHLDLDLTPPTDDRPFFFNMLPLSRAHLAMKYRRQTGVIGGNIVATVSLLTILLVCIALVVATIVLPLKSALREVGRDLVTGGTAYFALLGLGFMFVEIGLLQRLGVFLGHPAYSLSVVLFSLILTTGAGSWLSETAPLGTRTRIILWALGAALYLILLPAWLPAALRMAEASGVVARAALSAALIAPAGLLMGFGFPTGMQLVRARDGRPTPWFWGINGAAGVLASVLAVALNITFGIHVTLVLGALCYLALIPSVLLIQRAPARPSSIEIPRVRV